MIEPPAFISPEQQSQTPAGWLFVQRVEDQLTHVKSLVEQLKRDLPRIPERKRQELVSQIDTAMSFLRIEFRSLAANRGDIPEFEADLKEALVSTGAANLDPTNADYYARLVRGVGGCIEVFRRYQERYGFLAPLTEPSGADYVDVLIDRIRQEIVASAERALTKRKLFDDGWTVEILEREDSRFDIEQESE